MKFLKSDTAEGTQIKNGIKAMALSHPQVEFRVKQQGKLVAYWPCHDDPLQRAKSVLELDEMFEGSGDCNGIKTQVLLGAPNVTVRSSRQIWMFVQNRWVQDKGIRAAIMDGYRSLLMHGEYPYAVVFVSCPFEDIDVNIHPTKSQVKFRNSSDVFRSTNRATQGALQKNEWVHQLLGGPVENGSLENGATLDSGEFIQEGFDWSAPANMKPASLSSGDSLDGSMDGLTDGLTDSLRNGRVDSRTGDLTNGSN